MLLDIKELYAHLFNRFMPVWIMSMVVAWLSVCHEWFCVSEWTIISKHRHRPRCLIIPSVIIFHLFSHVFCHFLFYFWLDVLFDFWIGLFVIMVFHIIGKNIQFLFDVIWRILIITWRSLVHWISYNALSLTLTTLEADLMTLAFSTAGFDLGTHVFNLI